MNLFTHHKLDLKYYQDPCGQITKVIYDENAARKNSQKISDI